MRRLVGGYFGVLIVLAAAIGVAGCGSGGSSTPGTSTAETTPIVRPSAEAAVARKRELEKKMCEYDEAHRAAQKIAEKSEGRWAVVIPLLRRYEAEPSGSLAKRIVRIEPTLAHYNPINGTPELDGRAVKKFLGEEKELLARRSC